MWLLIIKKFNIALRIITVALISILLFGLIAFIGRIGGIDSPSNPDIPNKPLQYAEYTINITNFDDLRIGEKRPCTIDVVGENLGETIDVVESTTIITFYSAGLFDIDIYVSGYDTLHFELQSIINSNNEIELFNLDNEMEYCRDVTIGKTIKIHKSMDNTYGSRPETISDLNFISNGVHYCGIEFNYQHSDGASAWYWYIRYIDSDGNKFTVFDLDTNTYVVNFPNNTDIITIIDDINSKQLSLLSHIATINYTVIGD